MKQTVIRNQLQKVPVSPGMLSQQDKSPVRPGRSCSFIKSWQFLLFHFTGITAGINIRFYTWTRGALPSFILLPRFRESNEHWPATSDGGFHYFPGISVKSCVFTEGQARCLTIYTPLLPLPLCPRSPRCASQTVKGQFQFFHTVRGSKGCLRGM